MKHILRSLFFVAALTLAACAGGDGKYPYPPQFATPEAVPPTVLKPPPRPGSKTYRKELEMVIANQRTLTDEQKEAAMDESKITPEMITLPVLGDDFTAYHYPATYRLLAHAASDAWRIGDVARDYWKSPRPHVADERVQLYVKPIFSGSYPSGHTLTNQIFAHILGDLLPEYRVKFFQRADEIANNRVRGGVHYFFDLRAATVMAEKLYCNMKKSPQFREEFLAARDEIASGGKEKMPLTMIKKCGAS